MQAFYNLLFMSLPVIVVGLFDQDVSKVRPRICVTTLAHERSFCRRGVSLAACALLRSPSLACRARQCV